MTMSVDIGETIDKVKAGVSIPKYFAEIIVPEMPDYFSDYNASFESRPVTLCPLHDEDTPSFRYYEETNTFYCFGCRAGGDVINLHRKFTELKTGEKLDFKEALLFLDNYFLKGIQSADIVNRDCGEEKLSSVAEVLAYSNYVDRLEKRLMRAVEYSMSEKIKLYQFIDAMNVLTSKNLINASEATKCIRNYTAELMYNKLKEK